MADELRVLERPALGRRSRRRIPRLERRRSGRLTCGRIPGRRRGAPSRFAEIDPEGFFDFQSTRPHVSLVDGLTRRVDWPENAFYHAQLEGADRDAILLLGIEPNLRWRAFAELIVGLPKDLGVR